MEKWVKKELQYKGKIFDLWTGEAKLDNGKIARRDIIEHPGGVGVVPVLDDTVLLVKQYRIAIERDIIEIPAGKIEKGEDPETCAYRELEEEIGYKAKKLVHIASCYSSVGFTDEKLHIYIAPELIESNQNFDADESIEVIKVPISQISTKLARKEFEDAKTIIGLQGLLSYYKDVDW